MKTYKPTKQQCKKDSMLSRLPDVRPLNERETKFDTRKGIVKAKCAGFFDTTEYKEQLLF